MIKRARKQQEQQRCMFRHILAWILHVCLTVCPGPPSTYIKAARHQIRFHSAPDPARRAHSALPDSQLTLSPLSALQPRNNLPTQICIP